MRLDRLFVGLVFAFAIACGGGSGGGGGGGDDDDGDGGGDMDAGPDGGGGGDGGGDDGGDDGGDADAGVGCGLVTCESSGATCGEIGDGCGTILECGECSGLETCGGGGEASECGGSSACVPATCESAGATCGQIGDGCGGVTPSCGTCTGDAVCGGNGVPSVCSDEGPGACVGLCEQQTECASRRHHQRERHGVHAVRHVGSGLHAASLQRDGLRAERRARGADHGQRGVPELRRSDHRRSAGHHHHRPPTARSRSTNMPVGENIPLVIQAGKWRRVVTIPTVTACVDTPLPADLTRFPRTQGEGNADGQHPAHRAHHRRRRRAGVPAAQDGNRHNRVHPAGTALGRVNLYGGHGGTYRWTLGVNGGADFPFARSLWDSATDLNDYDMVILSCEGAGDWPLGEPASGAPEPGNTTGNRGFRDQSDLTALKDYLDLYGGRVFASHWHHSWVELAPAPMNAVGTFNHRPNPPQLGDGGFTVQINQAFPKGAALAQWLFNVGASTTLGQLLLRQARHDVMSVDEDVAFRWIDGVNPNDSSSAAVQYMSFNTPTDAAADEKCGRMVVTDIHVSNTDTSNGSLRFPAGGCTSSTLLPEEKALIFMLFDLASCVTTDEPVCDPQDCVDAGATCGQVADGCGELINCGSCEEPDTCGGGRRALPVRQRRLRAHDV